MSFDLPFGNLTDYELLSFINEHDILSFSQCYHLVFQPLVISENHNEIYNPDGQINTYNNKFTCNYFDLDNKDLDKNKYIDRVKITPNPRLFKY